MSEKQARPWMAPLTAERMADMLKANEHLAVFKNADSVLVGDLVVMVEEITQSRRSSPVREGEKNQERILPTELAGGAEQERG